MGYRPGNHLLANLHPEDLHLLAPHLLEVQLDARQGLQRVNEPIRHIYFLESGLASAVAQAGGAPIEVGLVGREGMTGLPVILGDDCSPLEVFVQISGFAWRIDAQAMNRAMAHSLTLRAYLLRFAQAFMTQTALTALANGRSNVEPRLARWLLMAQDRLEGEEILITHEFLALILGVRRAGITVALHDLERAGLVHTQRGMIQVRDRAGLIRRAEGIYGAAESEYKRLIGWAPIAERAEMPVPVLREVEIRVAGHD